jgi:hypothetical protein
MDEGSKSRAPGNHGKLIRRVVTVEEFECPVTATPEPVAATSEAPETPIEGVATPECACVKVTTTIEEFDE